MVLVSPGDIPLALRTLKVAVEMVNKNHLVFLNTLVILVTGLGEGVGKVQENAVQMDQSDRMLS